jgi:phosphatidylglycerol---prolipoprotein diacylglyceryl transferase
MIDPVCFTIGNRPIYWYGVMVALGFLVAVAHWNALGRRHGRPRGFGSDLGFVVMVSGILGARLAYVLSNFSHYAAHPIEVVRIDRGGLIFYGGFLGACAAIYVLARIRKEPPLGLGDFVVTGLPLGHTLGRVGCLLNGCCYGLPSDVPWRIYTADAFRHPVPLYEAAFNVILYVVLLRMYPRRRRDGDALALYLVLYGAWRYFIEFLRGDERAMWLGMSVAQAVSLALAAAGLFLWLIPRGRAGTAHA